jgi:hypothetical protein
MSEQPSYEQLNRLWTSAIECEGIGGASMDTLHKLYEARMEKFTWVGQDECNLRIALDKYLAHRGYKQLIAAEIEDD